MELLNNLINLGYDDSRDELDIAQTRLLNRISLINIPTIGLYTAFNIIAEKDLIFILADFSYIFFGLLVLFLNYKRNYFLAKIVTIVGFTLSLSATTMLIGAQNNIEYLLLITCVGVALLFSKQRTMRMLLFTYVILVLIALKYFLFLHPEGLMNKEFPIYFNLSNTLLVFILIYFMTNEVTQRREKYARLLLTKNEEFKRLNNSLEEKVKDRTAALNRSSEEMKRFSYVTSHDLRGPITTIMGFLTLIESDLDKKEYENLKEYLGFIEHSTYRLDALTRDIAIYIGIEEELESIETFDGDEVLKEVFERSSLIKNQDNIYFSHSPLPMITANKNLVNYIFNNLISNAIQYCDKDRVNIRIQAKSYSETHNLYEVTDNGMGISSQFYDEIFVMFTRLHNNTDFKGSGIGLAVCKRIIEAYKGKIWVNSIERERTTFSFTLPK